MCACTHVAPLENVLVAASLLRTFLKAPCHLELFQENNLSRGRPRVGVLRTYQAPRHASLPKHFCLCRSASVYVTWWSCLGESQQFFTLASQVFFFLPTSRFPILSLLRHGWNGSCWLCSLDADWKRLLCFSRWSVWWVGASDFLTLETALTFDLCPLQQLTKYFMYVCYGDKSDRVRSRTALQTVISDLKKVENQTLLFLSQFRL